jgi:dipeptidyl aminopeptidase/acylaminoacyl peptidase
MRRKKYPLLYCQGGPQSPDAILFFPLEFSANGRNGYIVVAPNRRGMPGYGVEMNKSVKTGAADGLLRLFSY